jgi:hypothetical protein
VRHHHHTKALRQPSIPDRLTFGKFHAISITFFSKRLQIAFFWKLRLSKPTKRSDRAKRSSKEQTETAFLLRRLRHTGKPSAQIIRRDRFLVAGAQDFGLPDHAGRGGIKAEAVTIRAQGRRRTHDGITSFANFVADRIGHDAGGTCLAVFGLDAFWHVGIYSKKAEPENRNRFKK